MTKAAVIGLGTMGPGIAATLARAGLTVTAFDADAGQRAKAPKGFEIAAGVLTRLGLPDRSAGEIAIMDSLAECVGGADLVVETVPEKLELKIDVFRQIEAVVGPDCVLASDTSGIPITKIQAGLAVPGRVVGMHWSNPPHVIPAVEIVPGALVHERPPTERCQRARRRKSGWPMALSTCRARAIVSPCGSTASSAIVPTGGPEPG
jgi:3-hydroxybutyryl-CoA dehydrogenase/5-formyl-3-hydroxy-2-methylpyridine 4-carboxylate dehydrogenase